MCISSSMIVKPYCLSFRSALLPTAWWIPDQACPETQWLLVPTAFCATTARRLATRLSAAGAAGHAHKFGKSAMLRRRLGAHQ